ncbi:hypothetical protein HYC85_021055 [Camellia sinensis]|uniref:Uncharacterized protein n=1 Tax=Camellia sinensis TaxID=4442 RepID=A0A7J7GKH7_CAMSI|nr:hypothetical protein HYC85_021055 [Camellia sinensis]
MCPTSPGVALSVLVIRFQVIKPHSPGVSHIAWSVPHSFYNSCQVIKPSVVAGFENAALVARWAQQQGKMSVISAKFESSLFLSAYLQFSYYLELQKADICMAMNKEPSASIAHGLGTYHWLKEDITAEPLNIRRNPCSGFIEASVDNAGHLLGNFQVENKVILRNFTEEEVINTS